MTKREAEKRARAMTRTKAADALAALALAHRRHAMAVRKLARVAAGVANEIAAASAAQTAELTALRLELAACFRPEGDDAERPRRIGRRA